MSAAKESAKKNIKKNAYTRTNVTGCTLLSNMDIPIHAA